MKLRFFFFYVHPSYLKKKNNIFSDLLTQLNMQNMDSSFIGIICSSYNTDTTTMVSELNNNIEMSRTSFVFQKIIRIYNWSQTDRYIKFPSTSSCLPLTNI